MTPVSAEARLCHELDTPLGVAYTAASVQAERLRELEGAEFDAAHARAIADLRDSAALLADCIGRAISLLDEQRRRLRGDGAAPPVRFALGACLHDALRLTLAKFAPHEVECEVHAADDLVVDADPLAWSQVIANLASNSVLHGFGLARRGRIEIACERLPEQRLRVTYFDDGAGFRAGLREQAFRVRFTTRASEGGSGLGLSIVHELVRERLQATIETLPVERGVAFVIEAPLAAPLE